MTPPANTERYKNHRFPGDIISHGVGLNDRFTLSYRDVQEMLLERSIDVTYAVIRQWCLKFGPFHNLPTLYRITVDDEAPYFSGVKENTGEQRWTLGSYSRRY